MPQVAKRTTKHIYPSSKGHSVRPDTEQLEGLPSCAHARWESSTWSSFNRVK